MLCRGKCVFCVICGDNPSGTELLVSTDDLVAIRDIRPAGKHHFLVMSREHIRDAKALTAGHKPLLQGMVSTAERLLREHGADMADALLGFHWPRTLFPHLHLHVISPSSNMRFVDRVIFRPNSWWFVSPEYVMKRL